MRTVAIGLAAVAALSGCAAESHEVDAGDVNDDGDTESSYTFLAIGDWGGRQTPPYTQPGEIAVAKAMGHVAQAYDAKMVLGIGDNFYSTGIEGDVNDMRFQKTFEDVYTAKSLQVPWYMCAGNHDHRGNITAQLAYTHKSPRWNFPELFHAHSATFQSSKGKEVRIAFIGIDTVVLTGQSYEAEDGTFVKANGPENLQHAADSWEWLEQQLQAASSADYLFVYGHYPVWSACSHGPNRILVARLKPLLLKYKATAYLSGHDHCMEHMDDGSGLQYFLTGAADECCYALSEIDQLPKNSLKFHLSAKSHPGKNIKGSFMAVRVKGSRAYVKVYSDTRETLYVSPDMAPRKTTEVAAGFQVEEQSTHMV